MMPTFIMMSMKQLSGATNDRRYFLLIEAKTHGPAGLDHAALNRFIAGLVEPPLPGRPEDEPKVVNTRVVLALFNEERIMLGSLAPVLIAGASGEDPHHAAEESLAPIRPCLAAVLPLAVLGIQREEIGIIGDQPPHLSLRELQRL